MKEVKDPEIKLFGKKIFLSDNGDIISVGDESSDDSGCSNNSEGNSSEFLTGVEESGTENEDEKIGLPMENCKLLPEENKKHTVFAEESQNIEVVSVYENSPESISMDEDVENDDEGDTNTQQKTLGKPDKIIPCPRCNSMDTKFCYYNNYNVNQPRYFCKSCQRYWTAGGTMRNVPVGAGRRKNKNFCSHNHSISAPESYQAAQMDAPNGLHHPNFKPNGTILSFCQELPVCDPVSSVLNLTNKKSVNGCSNGQQEPVLQQMSGFSTPVPYLPGVPWLNPWNSAVQMSVFCPPGYHIPVYPTPLWNHNMTGSWSCPWLAPLTPPVSQNLSSTLGKHSRNGETIRSKEPVGIESQELKSSEGSSSILVPKTLRIDDPEEAAKSSIWTTLGIKYDSMSNKGKLFKAFEQKSNEKNYVPLAVLRTTTTTTLQMNPAAISRSLTFQERV